MPEVSEETLQALIKSQEETETRLQERIDGFETVINALPSQGSVSELSPGAAPDPLTAIALQQRVQDLEARIEALESVLTGYQLPRSYRYRNDGAEGVGDDIHQMEWIAKPTPYSDSPANTTFWPDDQWTLMPGTEAVVQA